MKKILTILALVASFYGKAQLLDGVFYTPIKPPYAWQSGIFKANLNIPKVMPTFGKDTGAIYYRLTDSTIVVWTGSQWRTLGSGGGGSADSSVFATQYRLDTTRNGIRADLNGKLSNITGLVTAGTNVTITGSGTTGSPYVVNATGGSSTDTTSLSSRINNAYNSVEGTADSTGLVFIKPNGGRDTVSILGASGGGGGGEVNTASNVGTGAQVFKEKSGVDLRFRSIIGTNGITVTQNTDDITISPTIAVTRGTFAQRPASPDTGQLYWQTDRLAGQWEYDGIEWRFRGVASKFDFNETFSAGSVAVLSRVSGLTGGTGAEANIFRQKGGTSYLRMTTGTTTTGYSSYQIAFSEETTLQLDSVITYREFRVRLPILSDGTETYESAVGWLGHQSLWSFMTLGFHYTHSNNGGRWETRTRKFDNSANMTVKDTGVPVVANQWYKMGIEVNGFTNTIYFYIDDVLVATHTSAENIPIPNSTTGNQYNYGIAKQAGTTARVMDVDHAISYIIKQSY